MVLAYNNFDRASDLKIKILPANESPQFIGVSFALLFVPIQHASDLSKLSLREEYS